MASFYAWATIKHGIMKEVDGTWESETITYNVGDKVDAKVLGDDFDNHVASGAVRDRKYPDIPNNTVSPVVHLRNIHAKFAAENDIPVDAVAEVHEIAS